MIIKGIKKIAGETKGLEGFYSPCYLQLNYDVSTGEAWTNGLFSVGHNDFVRYKDENILRVCFMYEKTTMKELREKIEQAVSESGIIPLV